MTKTERQTRVDAFKADILRVCEQHGLTLSPWRVEYDEYDSDEGLEILPGEPYDIRSAVMADSGVGYHWKGFR